MPAGDRLVLSDHRQLQDNQLVGSLPSSLASASALVHLNASYNALSGQLPTSLNALTVIDLQHNNLEGLLPSTWGIDRENIDDESGGVGAGSGGSPAGVRVLALSNNPLKGTIPASWGDLGLLELELSHMQLTGTVRDLTGMWRTPNPPTHLRWCVCDG